MHTSQLWLNKKMLWTRITIIFSFLLSFLCSQVQTNTCDTYNHPQYGKGHCINENECSNSYSISGLCESYPANVKCCFSVKNTTYEEFRAVWIATVENIDWPSSKTATTAQQQTELINILNTVQLLNMNVVIFQVFKTKFLLKLMCYQDLCF